MLPDWVDQSIVVIAVTGVPIVIVGSWLFEWGPSGLVADDGDTRYVRVSDRQHDLADEIAKRVYCRLLRDMSYVERVTLKE